MSQLTAFKISPVEVEARKKLDLRSGYTVKVTQKVPEKDGKFRSQLYEGLVIARKHGTEPGATFTVRRVASGVGMEKIFPLYSPMIEKIEVVRRVKVRRSKLYYIREKAAREIRRRMRKIFSIKPEEKDELVELVTAGVEVEPIIDELLPEENLESAEAEAKTEEETK